MVLIDRTIHLCRILQGTEIIDDHPSSGPGPGTDDLIDAIVAEYEPLVARTRWALAGVWHDRKVSKTTLFVLMQLEMHGSIPMGRLAGLLDAGLSNVTGIVSRMEDLGFVERIRDEHDRRVVLVSATARGSEMVQELESIRRQHLRRLVVELDPSDRQACLQAFRALRGAAERLDHGEPPAHPAG